MDLNTSIEEIPRVGPQYQKKLKKMGVQRVGDLLWHFPHRYEDFSNLIPIAAAKEAGSPAEALAKAGKPLCFQGEILEIKNIFTPRKRMVLTQATISDQTGKLKVIWFNQSYLINTFKKGDHVCLAGKIAQKGGSKYLSSPAYEKIPSSFKKTNADLTHTGRLIPVYPETEGLSSKWLRFIIKPLLIKIKSQIQDSLPEKIKEKYAFLPLPEALWQIHFPDSLKLAQAAKKRFAFEELLTISFFVLRERMKLAREKAISITPDIELMKEFMASLPFKLTNAQKKCAWQILKDLENPRPMNRLLEGDVGSGKTIVAIMAALNVARAGYQIAFMAPTEILARQHFKTINQFLEKFKLKTSLITGQESYYQELKEKSSISAKAGQKIKRQELLEKIKNGQVNIVIGTHALIQENVKFGPPAKGLALVIIDEQHRFGVEQRAKLCQQKELIPHLLSMTATPIPRTLSLTVYGDLDLSIIDELPKGRKKIITKIIQPKDKKQTCNFIRKQVKNGRQVFVICPRIEPRTTAFCGTGEPHTTAFCGTGEPRQTPALSKRTETDGQSLLLDERVLSWLDVKAVKAEYEKLSKDIFPDLKIGMLHGKMKTEEKEKIMQDFKKKRIDILVSTSVVEVGVDVPNATVMIIEGSEKFGLAQLHQFRGRVGRREFQSYCFLFTDTPGLVTNRRLRAFVSCDDGFELAEKDLAIRGPGDFSGQRQWGIPDLTMASLTDVALVETTRNEAKEILKEDPELKKYPLLQKRLEEFKERIHLE